MEKLVTRVCKAEDVGHTFNEVLSSVSGDFLDYQLVPYWTSESKSDLFLVAVLFEVYDE